MKPVTNIDKFLKRFNNFKDGEFRSIEVSSATTMLVTLAGQDEARAFDWIALKLEFTNVSDARLLDNAKLLHVDMSDGISIIKEDNSIIFGIGQYNTFSSVKNATCFIESEHIKYEEDLF